VIPRKTSGEIDIFEIQKKKATHRRQEMTRHTRLRRNGEKKIKWGYSAPDLCNHGIDI